jgi:hypothetical protein
MTGILTYQAYNEYSCDDYVGEACGQEPYKPGCVQFWLSAKFLDADDLRRVPNTAA